MYYVKWRWAPLTHMMTKRRFDDQSVGRTKRPLIIMRRFRTRSAKKKAPIPVVGYL